MKVLKIKENADLEQLKNIGFEFLTTDADYMQYCNLKLDDTSYWQIDKNGFITYQNIIYSKNFDKIIDNDAINEIGVPCKINLPAFIYYLVKCDFVEVVEVD